MRAATALNLRAVLKSSEKRHMSSPTLIVSHKTVSMNCSRSSRLHFIAQQSKSQLAERSIRSKASERLNNNIEAILGKVDCKKDGKACGKHKRRFSVSTVRHPHTHTSYFLPFCFTRFGFWFPSVSVTHFHFCLRSCCLFRN